MLGLFFVSILNGFKSILKSPIEKIKDMGRERE